MNDDLPESGGAAGSGRTRGVFGSLLVLTLVAWAAFPAFAWFGFQRSGGAGIQAAAVAAVVCWASAAVALWLNGTAAGRPEAISAHLLGMLVRVGAPLLAGVVLHRHGGPLAKAGVFGMILAYYFLTLTVETILAVRLQSPSRCRNALKQVR